MRRFATSAAVLLLAILLAGCVVRNYNNPERVDPTSVAALIAQGAGVVVTEFFVSDVFCNRGTIGLGPTEGTEIEETIETGLVRDEEDVRYASRSLPAGQYHILMLECRGYYNATFAQYRREPGILASPVYAPTASFTVNPGEVVYIGSFHATSQPKSFIKLSPAAIGVEDRSKAVRQKLAETEPDLANVMVVRLAEGLPAK